MVGRDVIDGKNICFLYLGPDLWVVSEEDPSE